MLIAKVPDLCADWTQTQWHHFDFIVLHQWPYYHLETEKREE